MLHARREEVGQFNLITSINPLTVAVNAPNILPNN